MAGPCAIEDQEILDEVARALVRIKEKFDVDMIFKSSFDKANRSSITSYRGVGIDKGMQMLNDIRSKWGLKIVTDIHEPYQAPIVAEVVDVIQIPAFLCRQTDLIMAAAKTGKVVNIKKAQFLSGSDMLYPYQKAISSGAEATNVWLTERGNKFGYDSLVVDFRNIVDMQKFCSKVIMDCTHCVQNPVSGQGMTGGSPEYISMFAKAAKAFGANGLFFEVHPEPRKSKCDAESMLELNKLEILLNEIL